MITASSCGFTEPACRLLSLSHGRLKREMEARGKTGERGRRKQGCQDERGGKKRSKSNFLQPIRRAKHVISDENEPFVGRESRKPLRVASRSSERGPASSSAPIRSVLLTRLRDASADASCRTFNPAEGFPTAAQIPGEFTCVYLQFIKMSEIKSIINHAGGAALPVHTV